mmetsp:Transcript_7417/g.10954  ORF Transcript_7417/g.10954 Transcript_7417/m.10954 type:complete len:639 (-) Transcript_7417:36-1952(-)
MDELQLQVLFSTFIQDEMVSNLNFSNQKIQFDCDQITNEYVIEITGSDNNSLFSTTEQKYKFSTTDKDEGTNDCFYKSGNLLRILESFLKTKQQEYNNKILEYGDGETPIPTPMTQVSEEDVFDLDSFNNPFENKEFYNDVVEARALFGSEHINLLQNLNQLRIRLVPSYIPDSVLKLFKFDKYARDSMWFSITFGPAYLYQDTTPDILYKQVGENQQSIGVHATNILSMYMKSCWGQSNHNIKNHPIFSRFFASFQKINYKPKTSSVPYIALNLAKNEMDIVKTINKLSKNRSTIKEIDFSYEFRQNHRNFVIELITFLYLSLNSIKEYCINCGKNVNLKNITVNRPFICTAPICQYQYIENICGVDLSCTVIPTSVYTDLKNNKFIADLLISMAWSAANSNRNNLIFNPNYKGMSASQVAKHIEQMPSVDQMVNCRSDDALQDKLGQTKFNLLEWILSHSRPLMVKIPQNQQIKSLNSSDQYLLQQDDAEKHDEFKRLYKEYGSFFAFHGSSLENFHSILRRGLINASNTKLMTTGAAYGAGIYMAVDMATSFSYARVGPTWHKSKLQSNGNALKCMAICEVIKHPSINTVPNPYYVIKDAKYVTTRFFVIYRNSTTLSLNIKTIEKKLRSFYQDE